jgi:hypothetical protein
MKAVAIAGAAVALVLAVAPVAGALAPPAGRYDCVIGSGSTLFGTLVILPGGKYTRNGTKGTFTTGAKPTKFKDGRVGYGIAFKGGSLNKISGRWYPTPPSKYSSVTHEIALKNPRDGFESIYCDKWKK